ncbi:kinase-like domain-containing protein, partial [Usnea florida]
GDHLGEGTSGSVRLLDEPQHHAGNFQIAVKSFWDVGSSVDIRHEYLIASSLQHPNLIHTLDFRESFTGTHTAYHLLMEYLPYDLPAYTRVFLRPRQHLFRIFRQICQGVAYMHSRGLAHLDLKPENVLVNSEGTPKIIDFGSSEVVTPILLLPHSTCVVVGRNNLVHGVRGSEPYMPPEVYGEAKYDSQKADVWALGIMFVQIALGDYGMPWS